MPTVTEAERAFLDTCFGQHGSAGDEQKAVEAARFAVLKERLPPELLERAVHLRADYHKIRRRDSEMWDRFATLGFVGRYPGATLWKQIDDAAKKLNAGESIDYSNFSWDDSGRCP